VNPSGRGLRAALHHRDYRLLVTASSISQTGDWLYNVALLVWVYDATHSGTWVAVVTVARLVPYVVFGPLGGLVADTYDRRTVMIASDLLRAALMLLLAVFTDLHGPVALVAAIACISTAAGTAYRPAVVAMLPEMVGERDLAAANALESVVENLAVVLGPAIGAGLLVLGSTTFAFVINALTFVISAGCAAALHVHSRGSGRDDSETSAPEAGLLHGFRELGRTADARVLGGYMLGTAFIYGIQSVVLVLVAGEQLEAGTDGVGIFYAALGVGGIVGAALVTRLARSARLGAVLYASLLLTTLPMALLALSSSGGVAFVLVLLSSVGAVVLDVLALTQLQRAVSGEVLGRVWGALDALVVSAIILGSIVVAPVVDVLGADPAFVLLALCIPVLGLLGVGGLLRADRESVALLDRIGPAVRVFQQVPLLEVADRATIERLATTAVVQPVAIGEDVVVQGEPAEHFYVVESGRFDVYVEEDGGAPEQVNVLGAGDWFGEIGLLHDAPRTATVRARWPSRVWRIDGGEMLEALNAAPTMAATLLEGVASRIGASDRAVAAAPRPAPDAVEPA
jgi:CRP-like cAMP-binding protein/predicted MFS family arabinose efflux permease